MIVNETSANSEIQLVNTQAGKIRNLFTQRLHKVLELSLSLFLPGELHSTASLIGASSYQGASQLQFVALSLCAISDLLLAMLLPVMMHAMGHCIYVCSMKGCLF